jgi:polar amino acid transport system substrate-binding protein
LLGAALIALPLQASTLDRVRESGTIRVGSGNDTPPMNYIDDDGKWTGFDIDLADAMAERLGAKVERVAVNNKTRVTLLGTGQIDITVSNMSQTRSREEIADYASPPYLWTAKIFYARKGRYERIADLDGAVIGVNQGSNAFFAAPQEIERQGGKPARIVSFQKNAEGIAALRQGKIDAYCQDSPIIAALAGDISDDFEAVGTGFSPGLYGIGVPPDDSKWRDAVSFALQDLIKDGTYEEIYQKWFGAEGKFPMPLNARPRLPPDAFGDMLYVWPD